MKQKEDALQSLILSLTKGELKVLRHHLTISGKKDNKYLKLLDSYLKQGTTRTGISKSPPDKMLASRLKSKIFDTFSLDINLQRSTLFEINDLMPIILRKKIIAYNYLKFKQARSPFNIQLLNNIISNAKKYELYSILLVALRFLKYDYGNKKSEKYFNKINSQIEYYEQCMKLTRETNDLYFIINKRLNFSSQIEKENLIAFIIKNVEKLESENSKFRMPFVNYLLNSNKLTLHLLKEQYKGAKSLSEKIVKQISTQPSVFNKNRLASIYVSLNQLEIIQGNFPSAHFYAIEAKKIYAISSRNYFLAIDLEFHSLYYDRKFDLSISPVKELLKSSDDISGAFYFSKYHYYHANVLFKLKDYKNALKSLSTNSALRDDKSGWDIGLRVLTILCHIELGNYDQAMSATEALRKHINRSGRKIPVGERELIIFQMLNSLSLNSYDFQKTFVAQEKNLKLLKSNDPKVKYQYLEHELVKFDEWFEGKLKSE